MEKREYTPVIYVDRHGVAVAAAVEERHAPPPVMLCLLLLMPVAYLGR